MLLTAGAGTWEDEAYMTALIDIPGLDVIDLHVYPLGRNGNLLHQTVDLSQKARAAGKRVVVSESWLYKTGDNLGFSSKDFTTMIGRDGFSFWEPLDEEFFRVMTGAARAGGIEFVSFFWTRFFNAFLDYAQFGSMPLECVNQPINQASITNSHNGIYSPVGMFFKSWTAGQAR